MEMFGALHSAGLRKSFSVVEVSRVHGVNDITKPSDIVITRRELHNGDLLRVFSSITEADPLIDRIIDLEIDKEYYQEYQKDMDRELWCKLFSLRLPARLTKADGRVVDGVLEPFSEQGMEGRVAWSLYDFNNNSYGSLHTFKAGDHLMVFSKVFGGNIEWQGRIELEDKPFETGKTVMHVTIEPDVPLAAGLSMREEAEIIDKTFLSPPIEKLEGWSLRNLPAQIVQ